MSPNLNLRMLFLSIALFLFCTVESADECFNSTNVTWADLGNASEIVDTLTGFCSERWITNKSYSLYDGGTECIQVKNHSFSYQFSFIDPITLPPGKHVTFTRTDCMQLGRAVIAKCPHGGQLSLVPGNITTTMTIRAQPWSGSRCTGNGRNYRKTRRARAHHSSEPVPRNEYDGCYNGTNALRNVTWAMIDDTMEDIFVSLETACAYGHMGNRTYGATGPGVKRCIKTAHGGFYFTIQGLAPWWNGTTIANHSVFLSVGGCIALGMEASFKCDYGGYFTSVIIGPTVDATGQISANVGVEPILGDVCRHG